MFLNNPLLVLLVLTVTLYTLGLLLFVLNTVDWHKDVYVLYGTPLLSVSVTAYLLQWTWEAVSASILCQIVLCARVLALKRDLNERKEK